MKRSKKKQLRKQNLNRFAFVVNEDLSYEVSTYTNITRTNELLGCSLIDHIDFIDTIFEKGIDIWIDDEGKLNGSQPTLAFLENGNVVDAVHGKLCFLRFDDEGNTFGLTNSDIEFLKAWLSKRATVNITDGIHNFRTIAVFPQDMEHYNKHHQEFLNVFGGNLL